MIKLFPQYPQIIALLSEKKDGSMRRSSKRSEDEKNTAHRERFFENHRIDPGSIIIPKLIHGSYVARVAQGSDAELEDTDALVTNKKGVMLSVTVADCLPIFFFDPADETVGIAHVGWRGLADGIIANTVESLRQIGGDTKELKVVIGPGIQKCHFEIGKDVVARFAAHQSCVEKRGEKFYADLSGIARRELEKTGILEKNIEASALCTYCEKERFFSFRRDKPQEVKAMIALIGLR